MCGKKCHLSYECTQGGVPKRVIPAGAGARRGGGAVGGNQLFVGNVGSLHDIYTFVLVFVCGVCEYPSLLLCACDESMLCSPVIMTSATTIARQLAVRN